MAQTYDMTKGKTTPTVLKFFFPMFCTNMLQQIYTTADTAIVGKGIDDLALAAVGNMGSISFLIFGFAMGLTNGFSVSIAQAFGAKEYEKLRHSIAASLCLAGLIALVLTAAGNYFLKFILELIQTDADIMPNGLIYGHILLGGIAVTISYNLCSSILRALGDSKTPLFAIVISSALNILLDLLLICVWKTGVGGAAAATVASQFVSTLVCLRKLRKIDIIRLSREDFQKNGKYFSQLLWNGVPLALMNSITAVGCMTVQYFVNGLGVIYTTAYSACSRFINLFMQPACTAGFTMSAFTSQNYGAGEYGRIREGLKACMGIALITYLVLGSAMVLFPRQLAGLMINGEDAITLAATQFFPVCGVMLFAVDFLFVFRSGVQGMGKPIIPMISGIVEMVMRISIILIFVPQIGFRATAFAEVCAWTGALLLNIAAFLFVMHKAGKTETVG